jgi:hypothetical protein
MSGKICYDEIPRVKKLARLNCIQMPAFMRNQEKYKKSLKQIAHMNGLHLEHAKYKAPMAYIRRLKRGRRIGVAGGTKKVRKKGRKGSLCTTKGLGNGVNESTSGQGGSDNYDDDDDDVESEFEEEGFFFKNYKASENRESSGGDIFYETMKKQLDNMDKENEGNEKFSIDYYKALGTDSEKSKEEKVKEEQIKESKIENTKPDVPKRNIDWEKDCVQTSYRCVSRASVQSVLSLPSSSLNSRSRNPSSGLGSNISLRPLSSSAIGLARIPSTPLTELDVKTQASSENQQNAPNYTPSESFSQSSQSQTSNSLHSSFSLQKHIESDSEFQNNQVCTKSRFMNQAQPPLSPIKKDSDGFIYPDLLTEDMVKIQSGIQSFDINSTGTGTSSYSANSQVKLLDRRVKSAANILPKFTV